MTYREYYRLCRTKEYLDYKADFYSRYVIICLIVNALASALFSIKDIMEHHLMTYPPAIPIVFAFRVIPALLHIPVMYMVHKRILISTLFINIVLWIEIIAAFVGIHILNRLPCNYQVGTGWIAYYVMFYAFSIPTHLHFVYPINITLMSFIIIFTDKIGYLACPPGAIPIVTTSLFFSIPLAIALYYFKKSFVQYYALNKKLEKLAKKDALTDLYNRLALNDLADENNRALSNGVFILIDVDNFKSFNNKEGHELGDLVLKETANTLKSIIRSDDMGVRYGGDEFLVFLKDNINPESFYTRFIKFRTKVLKNYKVTYSFGAAFVEKGQNIYQIINSADKAMYKIKDSTKNGFCLDDNDIY